MTTVRAITALPLLALLLVACLLAAQTDAKATRAASSHSDAPKATEPARTQLGAPPEIIRPWHRGGTSAVGGVNLGGWLVLEPWITPSLFEPFLNATTPAVDEYTLTQLLGPTTALEVMTQHWDEWITEEDLQTIAQAGITHVRIPVGYWIVSIEKYEPFVEGGWPFLLRALGWCKAAGLKVLIDLHGAPGSQNGFDNSGRRGNVHWDDAPGTNILRTLYVLSNLTSLLTPWSKNNGGPVTAIELVNEPLDSVNMNTLRQFYEAGYGVVRANASSGFDLFIHDSFRLGHWTDFMQPPDYQNVYLDTHFYQVFDLGLLRMNFSQHLDYNCINVAQQEAKAAKSLWLVTGEWSLATTDCARWLNGFLRGSRWDGTLTPGVAGIGTCDGDAGNNWDEFSDEYKQFLRQFAEVQMETFENAAGPGGNSAGWFFWTLKTEGSPQWDFLAGLERGYIPNPVTARTHTCANRAEPQIAME